jgi:hypothetical protein
VVVSALALFAAWVAGYLGVLRPMWLNFLVHYAGMNELPLLSLLHAIPIVGLPVLIVLYFVKLTRTN